MRTFNYTTIIIFLIAATGFAQVKYTWNGSTGSWQTASNWNPSGVPGIADTAVINSGTVTTDQAVTVAGIFQNGGIINGAGNINMTAKFIWESGTHGGTGTTTIASSGSGELATAYGKTLSRTITIEGSLTITGAGGLTFSTGAQIINNGTMDVQSNSSVGNTNGSIVNNGSFTRSTSTGSATIASPFSNNGTISVLTGTLVSSSTLTGSGTFSISSGAVFRINSGTSTLGGNSVSGGGLFEISSGTLNFSGNDVIVANGTTFKQTSGTIGGDSNLLINGNFIWESGTHGGTGTTTIASSGIGELATAYGKTLSRTITIEGSLTITGAGGLTFSTGAQIINNGTMDVQSNTSVGNTNGSIVNNGTFIRSTSTGSATIASPFSNNGTISVLTGTLVSSSTLTGSGTFSISSGAVFRINSGTGTLGGNSVSGGGLFEISSGTLNFSGNDVIVANGTTFKQTSGTIGGDGNLLINGNFIWESSTHGGTGTTTIASSGSGELATAYGKTLSRTITIEGSLTITGAGGLTFSTGAQIINNGTMDVQSNSSVGNTNGSIVNNGSFTRSTSTGSATIASPFSNNGTISVLTGTLVSSSTLTGSGTFSISSGAVFRINSGTGTLGGNSVSGGGLFEISSGTLNFSGNDVIVANGTTFKQTSGTIGGDSNLLINGNFIWESGTHGGTGTTTIASSGIGELATAYGKTLSRTITIEGSLTITGAGGLTFSTGAQIINNGTMDVQSNTSVGNTNGSIVNNGTFTRSTSTGSATIASPFANNGTISVQTGTISFSDTLKNNLTAEINGIGTFTTPTGNRFINNGAVAPGVSLGILSINGNYPQTTSADLNIEIGGYQVGSERDSIFISSQAQLDGTLNIQFINNFLPSVGDVFTIMRYASRAGQFSQVNFSNNVAGQIQYLSNGAQVLITSGGVNQSPIAVDDAAQTDEDISVNINVLANDSDPDNDPLSITSFTQPLNGNAVQAGDSSITYTPALNFFGQDSLTYTIQDPNGATATAKVRITILPVNDPPSAPALILPVNGDTLNSNQTINFVWNASSDPENDPLSYALRIWGNSLDTTIAGLNDTSFAFNNPNAFHQNNSYQWQVTASDGNLLTLSVIRNFYIASTAMAGVYTIGIGGDYPTITSAVEALETFGIGGSVTFNILSGIYDEQIVIGLVAGASSINQIVFQSQSGNPEDVVWGYSLQSGSSNYVVLLQNASHLTFRNLSFKALNQSAGRLIGLGINTSNITIENNIFTGINISSSSIGYAIINSSDVALDSISILNNKFEFGSFAIRLYCNSVTGSAVVVQNNDCVSQSNRSILLDNISDINIQNNKIDNLHYFAYGVIVARSTQPIRITENRIRSRLGILLTNSTSTGDGALIANNFINVIGSPDTVYSSALGIRIISSTTQDVNIYYNTIRVSGTPQPSNNGIWVDYSTSTVQNIKNNIIVNEMGGPAILNYSTGVTSNYNNLYTTGAALVRWNNINYADLASYQTATGQDLNSLSVNPSFISSQDPYLNDFTVNNAGTPLAEVTTDIDGEPRHPNTPDIGADEFEPLGFKGIFTIGAGGDFPNITSAVAAFKDTIITGAVTFNILPGTYDEQVVIDSVNRVVLESPIVFQSQSGNPEDVVWGYSLQSNSSNYVVLLQNVSHLTFRNLSIKALNQSAGRLIGLGINTSNITIENNICIGVNTSSSSTGYAIINSSDVALDSVSITNNKFEFGSYAIRLDCNTVTGSVVVVQNNDCIGQGAHSILLDNIIDVKILKNRIDKSNGSGYAVGLFALQPPITVIENKILSKNYGLAFSSSNSTGERGLIANNFILVTVESSAIAPYGLRLNSTSDMKVDVYYNTIRIVGDPLQNTSSLYVGIGNTSSQYLKNNIIINEADGFVINNLSPGTISNYNDLYTTGATLVKWINVNYPDLSSYQTATSQDLNSISADPLFVDDDDLHIKSGSPVDGKGTPLAEVPRDIDNQLRSLIVPDIGADEYTAQRIIIKRKNKLNKTILPLTITRDSLHIDPTDDPMISGYVLSDVNVFIDTLFHTNLADLEISLTHNGEIDTLAKFLPDSASGFIGTILDDSGLLALNEGVSPYTGSFRPHSPLSVFNGIDPEGEWVLEIYDHSSGNFGILDAWGIELVFEQPTSVPDEQEENIIPDNFELSQNFPNPFNPSTTIRYSVPSRSTVVLKIYDILGGEVSTLVNEDKDAGIYSVNFNASQLASGMYLYRLQAGSFVETKKMILLR